MKTLYFDPIGGISGDMIVAALLSLGDYEARLREDLSKIMLPQWEMQVNTVTKKAISGRKVRFLLPSEQQQRNRAAIEKLLTESGMPPAPLAIARRAFDLLAAAESQIHQIPPEAIHFHEVGGMDTILDITAASFLFTYIEPDCCRSAPLPLGRGWIRCSHGVIPLPAPAVSAMLDGVSVRDAGFEGETVTPTGLALLKSFGCQFSPMPEQTITATGWGAGDADFPVPNLLRVFLGKENGNSDSIYTLETCVDDMTGEQCGFLMERAFEQGALDVWFSPVQMKKNRPGVRVTILSAPDKRDILRDLLFAESSTLGIIYRRENRWTLQRRPEIQETPMGSVQMKRAWGYGANKCSVEYENAAAMARSTSRPLADIQNEILKQRGK